MPKLGRWTWVHVASLAVAFVTLTVICRGQWFFGDEWDFLLLRGLHHPQMGLFFPHNEHWSTIPILMYRAVFSVFAVRTYWPYLFVLFAVHLSVVHLVWRHSRKVGVPTAAATGVAFAFALFGGGSENLLWAFQIGFVGSLAAGLAIALAVDREGSTRRVAGVAAACVLSLMFSGISVVMVGVVGLLAFRRWGWRRAAAATAPAAVVYLAWLKWQGDAGLKGASKQFHGGLSDIPRYVFGGISATFGAPFKSLRVGEVIFWLVVVVTLVNLRRWWETKPEALALGAGAPLMFAVISQGRGTIQDPAAPRYLYLALAMLLPLVTTVVWTVARRVPAAPLLVAAGATVLAVTGAAQLNTAAKLERTRELALRGQFIAAVQLKESGAPVINDTPDYLYAQSVRIDQLVGLVHHHEMRVGATNARDKGNAQLGLQVSITAVEPGATLGGAVAALPAGMTLVPDGPACFQTDFGANNLEVHLNAPNVFSVASRAGGRLDVFIPFEGGNAGGRRVDLKPNDPIMTRMAVPGVLVFQLPPGPVRICGIKWLTG